MVPWMYSLSHRKCRPPPQGKALEMGSPAGESPRAHKYGVLQCILMALFSYCEMIVWNYGAVFIDCQRLTVHRDVILLIPLLKRGGGSEEVNLCLRCYHKILDISTISLHSVFQPILYKVLVPKKTFFIVLFMFYSPEFVSAWLNCWHVMVRSVFPRALQWVLTFCLGVISQHCVMACSQIVIVSVTQRQFSVVRVNIPQEKLCLYV